MRKNKLFRLASIVSSLFSTSVVEQGVPGKGISRGVRPRTLSEEEAKQHKEKLNLERGCKKFFYGDDNYVIALNQKNADRKARNAGWI